MLRLEKVPAPDEADHGIVLEEGELQRLVKGFKGSSLFPIVAVLAFTGMRRGEALALRWDDFDAGQETLRIERAVEQTKAGLKMKGPKKKSTKERLRSMMGWSSSSPPNAKNTCPSRRELPKARRSTFPSSSYQPQRNTTKEFCRKAMALGFPNLRLHDLRGTHESHLLDRGMSPAAVAQRCGHDPATMLRSYAKRTKKADAQAAQLIGMLSKGALA